MIRGMGVYRDGLVVDEGVSDADGIQMPMAAPELRERLEHMRALAGKEPGQFVWIGLFEPTIEEMRLVQELFELPELQVDDAMNHQQRPKAELGKHCSLVILKILSYYESTSDVETGQISIFLSENFVITVRFGPLGDITSIRHRLEHDPKFLGYGPAAVAHAIMDATVDGYVDVSDEVSRDIEQLEESVFSPKRTSDAEMIYRVKRENLEMRRAVMPLVPISHALVRSEVPGVPDALRPFYRDLGEHVLRVADAAESNDQLLMTLLMAATSRQDLQQNNDMRRISAYVAIAAVPTMIAGIYGMNFDNMPELHWRYGYLVILALMGGVCLALYRAFKRSGWL